jgi:hypothetical protein
VVGALERGPCCVLWQDVAGHWVEVVAVEASASGNSDVGLENLAAASETESGALVLALAAGSFRVT